MLDGKLEVSIKEFLVARDVAIVAFE